LCAVKELLTTSFAWVQYNRYWSSNLLGCNSLFIECLFCLGATYSGYFIIL